MFKAEKITTKEEYAIKFMKRMFVDDETLVERFKREFETLKSVRHPNVVNIYDWYFPPPRKDEFEEEEEPEAKDKKDKDKEEKKASADLVDGIAEPEQTTSELLAGVDEEEETTTKKEALDEGELKKEAGEKTAPGQGGAGELEVDVELDDKGESREAGTKGDDDADTVKEIVVGDGAGDTTQPYIVMEFLDGEPLNKRLRSVTRYDQKEAIRIMVQSLDALSAVHDAGIVHRDLGPQNIFLVDDPDGKIKVKILDFGLVRPVSKSGDDITKVGTIVGMAGYTAPEVFLGKPADPRSDIFACGMVLMRLLGGRLPYKEVSLQSLLSERVSDSRQDEEYPPARSFNKDIPKVLDAVISRAIRKKPEDRYQHAYEMQADLVEVDGEMQAGEITGVYKHSHEIVKVWDDIEEPESDEEKTRVYRVSQPPPAMGQEEASPGLSESYMPMPVAGRKLGAGNLFLSVGIALAVLAILVIASGAILFSTVLSRKNSPGDSGSADHSTRPVAVAGSGLGKDGAGSHKGGMEEEKAMPERVHVAVNGTPQGAIVKIGDFILKGDPPEGIIPTEVKSLVMEVAAAGYEKYTRNLYLDQDLIINVNMRRIVEPGAEGEEKTETPPGKAEVAAAGDAEPEEEKQVALKSKTKLKKPPKKKKAAAKPAAKTKSKKDKIIKGRLGTTISTDYGD